MAITDINISEQLQTDAPSIKYTGNEGPQNPQQEQQQQEQMMAQQIWEALTPEQQGQFESFEQFFQSGVWKQILQQMQADEGRGPETQQGIGSLGPEPMQQQMPMPNRMGAQYGGRMGYQGGEMVEESIVEKLRPGSVDVIEKIKYLMEEHGLSREEALKRALPEFRKPRDRNHGKSDGERQKPNIVLIEVGLKLSHLAHELETCTACGFMNRVN